MPFKEFGDRITSGLGWAGLGGANVLAFLQSFDTGAIVAALTAIGGTLSTGWYLHNKRMKGLAIEHAKALAQQQLDAAIAAEAAAPTMTRKVENLQHEMAALMRKAQAEHDLIVAKDATITSVASDLAASRERWHNERQEINNRYLELHNEIVARDAEIQRLRQKLRNVDEKLVDATNTNTEAIHTLAETTPRPRAAPPVEPAPILKTEADSEMDLPPIPDPETPPATS